MEPLDVIYLEWLYDSVWHGNRSKPRRREYMDIFRIMYTKEFVWLIANDDNRAEDGKSLRYEFLETNDIQADADWLDLGCSFLEMLIALSRRLAFETGTPYKEWFWHIVRGLGITEVPVSDVEEILDGVIWRTYSPDGTGGLFPLRHPDQDQTHVELWYQMSAYLLENGVL